MGKECCFRLSRHLWGEMKNELPLKHLCGRLEAIVNSGNQHTIQITQTREQVMRIDK